MRHATVGPAQGPVDENGARTCILRRPLTWTSRFHSFPIVFLTGMAAQDPTHFSLSAFGSRSDRTSSRFVSLN
ncbi:hypothetical protein Nepgr_008136 [Nepenthes gracilis]|uniref:Uncharacterized protein n=1 Tax=Nepenthes gracilis TaxID=150966 RepID=A0AAD3S8I7_NEPGR|nr:hypothetical protein Nepgr_008136 [Nepenthes gracilis]